MLASNFKKAKERKMWIIKKVSEVDYYTYKETYNVKSKRVKKLDTYMGKPSGCIGLASIFDYDFLAKKYSDFLASTFSWDISYLKLKSN